MYARLRDVGEVGGREADEELHARLGHRRKVVDAHRRCRRDLRPAATRRRRRRAPRGWVRAERRRRDLALRARVDAAAVVVRAVAAVGGRYVIGVAVGLQVILVNQSSERSNERNNGRSERSERSRRSKEVNAAKK